MESLNAPSLTAPAPSKATPIILSPNDNMLRGGRAGEKGWFQLNL